MKAKWLLRAFSFMAASSMIVACSSSSDDNGGGSGGGGDTFPEKQTFEVEAGETKDVTFTATSSFRLTVESGTSWCKLIQNDTETLQYTGDAGSHTATISVLDAGQDFDVASVATISLAMGTKSEVIIEITRPALNREVKMYRKLTNGTFEELTSLDFIFSGSGVGTPNIGFTANFTWKVLSTEGDFILANPNINGAAGQEAAAATYTYASLSSSMAYAFSGGKIVISDADGTNTFEFPVTYAGMDEEAVVFGRSSVLYGLEFTTDQYVVSDGTVSTATSVTTTVTASDMDYDIVFVDPTTYSVVSAADSWVTIADADGTLTISADANTGAPRELYFFVLPRAIASTTIDSTNIADYVGVYGSLIEQRGIVTSVTFSVYWGMTLGSVPVVQFASSSLADGGKTPQDWGAAATVGDDAFVCEVSSSDLHGSLMVMVAGLLQSGGYFPTFAMSSLDNSAYWTNTYSFAGSYVSVNLSSAITTETVGCLQFYDEDITVVGWTPAGDPACVLFIVQKP